MNWLSTAKDSRLSTAKFKCNSTDAEEADSLSKQYASHWQWLNKDTEDKYDTIHGLTWISDEFGR